MSGCVWTVLAIYACGKTLTILYHEKLRPPRMDVGLYGKSEFACDAHGGRAVALAYVEVGLDVIVPIERQ